MKNISNFRFRTSISREGYSNKEEARCCLSFKDAKAINKEKMAFKEREVTIDEFVNYATNGYAFCNLFNRFDADTPEWVQNGKYRTKMYPVYRRGANKGFFKLQFKSDVYFSGAQTIFVDVDYTNFTDIQEYINCLTYTPTIVYPSFSDNSEKKGVVSRRFRMVYVFEDMLDEYNFKQVTNTLYNQIEEDTNEDISDSCGCSFSQYMNGTQSKEVYTSDFIYSASDFPVIEPEYQVVEEIVEEEKVEEKEVNQEYKVSDEIYNDLIYMDNYEMFVQKWYAKGLRYFTKTELDFGDKYYMLTEGTDYCKLNYFRYKVKDGEKRRRKLFLRAALRRLMKPDVTPDELYYNLIIDLFKFFDNSDGVIDADCLRRKVEYSYKVDIDTIRTWNNNSTKFVINPDIAKEYKYTAEGKARKEIKDNQIGEVFDREKTVKDNQIELAEKGIYFTTGRLYQWCRDNHIKPVKKSIRNKENGIGEYNPNLSIRENMKALNCTMYQVRKMKKLYEERSRPRLEDSDC